MEYRYQLTGASAPVSIQAQEVCDVLSATPHSVRVDTRIVRMDYFRLFLIRLYLQTNSNIKNERHL